jgi:hypothetical protein
MKRITALLLAVVMAFGSVGIADTAQANNIDIKARGQWQFGFSLVDNSHFGKSYNRSSEHRINRGFDPGRNRNDSFEAIQRVRTQINFISGEHLQAVLSFDIGAMNWGRGGGNNGVAGNQAGGALNSRGINIRTRLAYLDWMIPETPVSVRMGIQHLALPSGRMGNPVFADTVAGIVVNSPITDNFALTGFWLRPFADNRRLQNDDGIKLSQNTDVFGLVAPITFSGVSFKPYFMYAHIGNASGGRLAATNSDVFLNNTNVSELGRETFDADLHTRSRDQAPGYFGHTFGFGDSTLGGRHRTTNAWWFGANLNVDILDPLVFNLDAIYGGIGKTRHSTFGYTDGNGNEQFAQVSASGWYIGATLDYKLDWGTPGIFGWYSSGDRKNALSVNDDGETTRVRVGRLPVLGTNDGFGPTSFGTAGFYGISNGNGLNDPVISNTGTGTWGIGIQLADVSFIQDLSHTLRFAYYAGTNSASNIRWGATDTISTGGARSILKYEADYMYLTTKDNVFEVNFDHVYKIYENLEVCLELGWLRLNSNRNTWNIPTDNRLKKNDDAWKAGLNFKYSF